MLRILTWTATGFEKMPSNDDASFATNCVSSGLSGANLSGKRKRSFVIDKPNMASFIKDQTQIALPSSQAFSDQQPIRDTPTSQLPESAPLPPSDKVQDVTTSVMLAQLKTREEAQLATMRQTISSQLSLEILMKHRELRLIDQELAKCQIALEQLRRCSEVPYPALQQPSEHVSTGTGPAIRKSSSKNQARSPAPWGVADGPYSRHYAKWLLSDPHFDGGESEPIPLSAGFTPSHGRSTRGIYTDFAQMVGKTSRSQRALHQGLPAGFVEPKQKPTGPMILKRKSDGKMVKLVCPDCARFDFGSAQGFINHCRIGHQRNFASHDAAAEGCGEAIETDENCRAKSVSIDVAPTPVATTPVATTPVTPMSPIVLLPTTNTSTHPLIKSAHLSSKDSKSQLLIPGGCVPKSERKSVTSQADGPSPQCAQTPNLSAFIQNHGLGVDLQLAVDDAKAKNHFDEDSEGDHDMDVDSPAPTPTGNSRHPAPAGKKPGMKSTESSVGGRKPSFVQARHTSLSNIDTVTVEHEYHGFPALLPSPTNESTQAPSLIDDDEEMDAGSPPSSDEHDDSDIPVHVRDDEQHEDAHDLSRAELPSPQGSCTQSNPTDQSVVSRVPGYTRPLTAKDNRQYSFIAETPMSGDQGDKKRRKVGN